MSAARWLGSSSVLCCPLAVYACITFKCPPSWRTYRVIINWANWFPRSNALWRSPQGGFCPGITLSYSVPSTGANTITVTVSLPCWGQRVDSCHLVEFCQVVLFLAVVLGGSTVPPPSYFQTRVTVDQWRHLTPYSAWGSDFTRFPPGGKCFASARLHSLHCNPGFLFVCPV